MEGNSERLLTPGEVAAQGVVGMRSASTNRVKNSQAEAVAKSSMISALLKSRFNKP